MNIQIRINEEGALRNQRFAFTDKFTLLSELMQNARRAGARRIEIAYDDATGILRVVDDGRGIADFQKLLTFNESGWDNETCDEERPFGIGFSKCLYSATRCIVMSRDRKIDFLTSEALARKPVEVQEIAPQPHTTVELHEVQLPDLKFRLHAICSGFPVQVWFNGVELPRIHAVDQLPFMNTSIGQVYLRGTGNGNYTRNTLMFLQGLCVARPSFFEGFQVNVVHLDSRQFVARLPDRDKLIDEDDQTKRVYACMKWLWRQALCDAKSSLDASDFVEAFFDVMRYWHHVDLINDVPVLPKCLTHRISGYPIQEGYEGRCYIAAPEHCVTRTEVVDGSVHLVDLDSVSSENAAGWMFAKAMDYTVLSPLELHPEHWVHSYIEVIKEASIRVKALKEQCRMTLDGRWITSQVILCDAVEISIGADCVTVTDVGVYCDGAIFIPPGEWTGEAVRQASDFIDPDNRFVEEDRDADRTALADLVKRLRCVDPQSTLASLLQELRLENYPLLRGKAFQLQIGHVRDSHVIEALPAPASHAAILQGRS
ncbi:ATP-binding protein [Massilia sp. CMS3.1]|uniref:ATP-binding protein n=1 Tax=Massilia sp. CMS3.1 TaxID=3373083 RepID=UPI003EE56E66